LAKRINKKKLIEDDRKDTVKDGVKALLVKKLGRVALNHVVTSEKQIEKKIRIVSFFITAKKRKKYLSGRMIPLLL